jgi:hypothetical protein
MYCRTCNHCQPVASVSTLPPLGARRASMSLHACAAAAPRRHTQCVRLYSPESTQMVGMCSRTCSRTHVCVRYASTRKSLHVLAHMQRHIRHVFDHFPPVKWARKTRTDKHASALSCIKASVRAVNCSMKARHARVRPIQPLHAGPGPTPDSGERRIALYGQDTHVCTLPHTCVLGSLRTVWARRARVRPVQHPRAGSASHRVGETRTCLPCPAPACWERFALCGRDTDVSALSRSCLRGSLALYGLDTHVSALSGTCVRGALRAA